MLTNQMLWAWKHHKHLLNWRNTHKRWHGCSLHTTKLIYRKIFYTLFLISFCCIKWNIELNIIGSIRSLFSQLNIHWDLLILIQTTILYQLAPVHFADSTQKLELSFCELIAINIIRMFAIWSRWYWEEYLMASRKI